MNLPTKPLHFTLNAALAAPAALLCTCGVLYSIFGLRAANDLLDWIMTRPPGRLLLSPFVVFGGPVLLLALNVRPVCGLRVNAGSGEIVVAFSVRRPLDHLIPAALGGLMLALLLGYAFVENFRIVPR
jgi:hypothetical protein